ncbi:protein of unknown function [Pedobacter sp. ok626]|uniref:DUF4397 domain-containing protein n=1 Tax=Pedobacter sp. ok626 TaxID=1761882 RepID=UPI0008867F70|nr:DUF4397 domain-containing protein [Pedobacter sp. ok626]SDL02163.1 protein of unknown function [Pedobacter sp. ok626]
MKISTKTGIKNLSQLIAVTLLLFSLLLTSCSKETETTAYAYLSVANVSPTLGTYNIYLDGTKSNTSGAVAFGGILAYSTLTAGNHTLSFTTESSVNVLATKTVSLEENGVYSAFLIDKGNNLDVLLIKDEINVASTEKAFIRFINLSPDAPELDLSVSEAETLISGKAYKSASAFQAIDPKTYSFELKANGIVKTILTDQTLTAGKYYTIIARGLTTVGDIDQPFGAQLITNL